MARKFLPLVLLTVLLVPAAARSGQAPPAQQRPADQSERIRQGVSHFERAFYELTPQKRDREAAQEFDQAVAQFELELTSQPSSPVAQAYLGRIHSIRKDFRKSATHYDRLSELEPLNVDACVLAALAYGELGEIADARSRLVSATQRTSDPGVLARLAEYTAKLDTLSRQKK
jgi:lipopolysaccharide biosynthesis regulator YciM